MVGAVLQNGFLERRNGELLLIYKIEKKSHWEEKNPSHSFLCLEQWMRCQRGQRASAIGGEM